MTDRREPADHWDATWEGARNQLLDSTLAATLTEAGELRAPLAEPTRSHCVRVIGSES